VAVQAQINDQTVSVLLDSVRSLLSEEEDRANSLSVRAGGITGFAGIILTLTGVAAKSGHTLEGSLRGAVAAMSVGALVFLALAVVVAVFGVLVPSSAVSISTAELERFPTWAFITQPPAMVQGKSCVGSSRHSVTSGRRTRRRPWRCGSRTSGGHREGPRPPWTKKLKRAERKRDET
jgi:hypothetical protein